MSPWKYGTLHCLYLERVPKPTIEVTRDASRSIPTQLTTAYQFLCSITPGYSGVWMGFCTFLTAF